MPEARGRTPAYLITIENVGDGPSYERKLVDAEAWRFIDRGGDLPEKVLDDTALACGDADEARLLLHPQEGYEFRLDDETVSRLRAVNCGSSTFGGETCPSDMNGMVDFIIKHGLWISGEWYVDNDEP